MAAEAVATRRRIIPRPRLTKLLDESPARIKLLVAPAGYGKTTLAQEWLEEPGRHSVWYRAGPAASDIAALAAGLAECTASVVVDAGKRMRERIRAVGHPDEDVEVLADLFAEDLADWPMDSWLAIDDYHFAMASSASERFVDLLTRHTPLHIVVTTRNRPSWATARRVLYGELQEIDRRALAMEEHEALEVLGGGGLSAAELVERARGWPAVLGIAALSGANEIPTDDLPDQLYDYFADELFRNASAETRDALHRVSLVPSMSRELGDLMFGPDANRIVVDCANLGAITFAHDELVLHPLLRTFLNKKLAREDPHYLQRIAGDSAELLISVEAWDAAFQVISSYAAPELLVPLVNAAVGDLLAEGRTQTLANWLDFAGQHHLSDAALDFAEAEVAFRQGRYAKAEALAAGAASVSSGILEPRMLIRAGQAAVMDSRDDRGLDYFRAARTVASTDLDRLEASVGVCFAALELGLTEPAGEALAALSAIELQGIEVATRKAIAQLVHSSRVGGVQEALGLGASIVPLLDDAKDPLVVTSFLNCYGHLLGLGAYYVDALTVADRQIGTAVQYRLAFALPHAYLVRAVALCGLRDFSRAAAEISRAQELAAPYDIHVAMQAAAIRTRLALCRRDFSTAVSESSQTWDRHGSRPMMAEYFAYRALSYACRGDRPTAIDLAKEARRMHGSSVETLTLAACAEAIAALAVKSTDGPELQDRAYDLILSTGGLDTLVTAGRAYPALLQAIAHRRRPARDVVATVLSRSNDFQLARAVGIELAGVPLGPIAQLTRREVEVAELVTQGHTNRDIAERLFISESTVKVHVRHILRKLDARKRAEIAARISAR